MYSIPCTSPGEAPVRREIRTAREDLQRPSARETKRGKQLQWAAGFEIRHQAASTCRGGRYGVRISIDDRESFVFPFVLGSMGCNFVWSCGFHTVVGLWISSFVDLGSIDL